MPRSQEVILTNMCLVENDRGQFVMQIRSPERYAWDGATLPGGHVEYGESFSDAVIREIKEETGLNIRYPQLCGIKDWTENEVRYVVLFYKTREFEGELQSSDEGEVWWEELDNLANLNLSLDMVDMVKVFMEEHLSEFFYRQEGTEWVYDLK